MKKGTLLSMSHQTAPKSKKLSFAFFIRAIKAVTGFFGFFLIFPFLIAADCYDDDEWIWNKLEVE